MPLMCTYCYTTYYKKYRSSTAFCKHCYSDLVEIDELFLESIVLLNKKGYYTKYCCSGHSNPKDVPGAYVYFEEDVVLPSLPNWYRYDKDVHAEFYKNYPVHSPKNSIQISFLSKNMFDLQKEILKSALDVLEWVESLPNCLE